MFAHFFAVHSIVFFSRFSFSLNLAMNNNTENRVHENEFRRGRIMKQAQFEMASMNLNVKTFLEYYNSPVSRNFLLL